MAESNVTILNLAGARLAQEGVVSFSERESTLAEYGSLFYGPTRRELLRSFNWNFAKRVITLGQTATVPPDYDYEYQRPPNCLLVRDIIPPGYKAHQFDNAQTERIHFDTRADKIVTDLDSAVCVYTIDVEGDGMTDPLFISALAWKLAFELAMPITGKHVLRDKMDSHFLRVMSIAQRVNGMEKFIGTKPGHDSDFLASRR